MQRRKAEKRAKSGYNPVLAKGGSPPFKCIFYTGCKHFPGGGSLGSAREAHNWEVLPSIDLNMMVN